jgi:purine-binding chemotaxis protein CheW
MQYLTFTIAGQTCAVEIENVRSVLEHEELTAIPGSPEYVAGLLNLRGEAVPVVDVRRKLKLASPEGASASGIIVLALPSGRLVGALVDSVCEVVQLDEPSIHPIEDFAVDFDRSVVQGIGKKDGRFVIIMAADRLFARDASWGSP